MPKGRLPEPWPDRFWKYVVKGDGCWRWSGSMYQSGRGYIKVKGVKLKAYRVMHELEVGQIPPGMSICHHCDNPNCVRPDHLFMGSGADNSRDMALKGRAAHSPHPRAQGERNGSAKLTNAQAEEVVRRYRAGESPTALGREFGVARQQVWMYATGRIRRHLIRSELVDSST